MSAAAAAAASWSGSLSPGNRCKGSNTMGRFCMSAATSRLLKAPHMRLLTAGFPVSVRIRFLDLCACCSDLVVCAEACRHFGCLR